MPHNRSVSVADYFHTSRQVSRSILSRAYSESVPSLSLQAEYHIKPKVLSITSLPEFLATGLLSPPASDDDDDGSNVTRIHKTVTHFQNLPISPSSSNCEGISHRLDLGIELHQNEPPSPSSLNSLQNESPLSDVRDPIPDDSFPFPVQSFRIQESESSRSVSMRQGPKSQCRCSSTGSSHWPPSTPPDRYISSRNSPQTLTETFRSSKSPHLLSGSEKLFRQKSSTPDPFGPISPQRLREKRQPISFERTRGRNEFHLSAANGVSVVDVSRNVIQIQSRLTGTGSVWNIGGESVTSPQGPIRSLPDGRGGWVGAGTNAPMYTANFFERKRPIKNDDLHEGRLAAALDIDQSARLLNFSHSSERGRRLASTPLEAKRNFLYAEPRTSWIRGQWLREGLPILLDAPRLRDDFYCTVLAYCHTSRTLAVGLGNKVYLWSEAYGVQFPHIEEPSGPDTYVTSLSFSSTQGGHSILAIGRTNGQIHLWSLHDSDGVRFQCTQPKPIACLAFKPATTERESVRFGSRVSTEELLVGDDAGMVFYYSIEWMNSHQIDIHGWQGKMTLMATISVHSQQICGLAWSQDGAYFATGANDNGCCLFDVKEILKGLKKESVQPSTNASEPLPHVLGPATTSLAQLILRNNDPSAYYTQRLNSHIALRTPQVSPLTGAPSRQAVLTIIGGQKHKWVHSAAVKAIAFCPWQSGLLATGGGSNDRAIHFWHTISGACLATIDVQAQVTSLVWSTSRREIAATFGYAQPEHPYRIAVFSWPECKQVVAIPWASDTRALLAIAYPGGPNETSQRVREGETWWPRTVEEGCIVVASSDESVKFHEVWSGKRKLTTGRMGLLGGSDILEALEGIEKEGVGVIR